MCVRVFDFLKFRLRALFKTSVFCTDGNGCRYPTHANAFNIKMFVWSHFSPCQTVYQNFDDVSINQWSSRLSTRRGLHIDKKLISSSWNTSNLKYFLLYLLAFQKKKETCDMSQMNMFKSKLWFMQNVILPILCYMYIAVNK